MNESTCRIKKDANEPLANRLKWIRKEKGMTQNQLACKSGVQLVTLQKLENGTSSLLRARVETATALARELGVTVEELVNI